MSGTLDKARRASIDGAAWMTLLSIIVALVPLSFSSHLPGRSLPAAVLFVLGLAIVGRAATRHAWAAAGPVLAAGLITLGFLIANVLVHQAGWRPLDHAAHVLLFLVIAAVFGLPLRMRVVWAGFSATALLLGGVCLVQHFVEGLPRAYGLNGGPSASIQLATVLLGLGLLSLVQLLGADMSRAERLLHAAAAGAAVYGALLTQSRGPLLAFIPMALVVILMHARRRGHWRGALMAAVGLALLLAIGAMQGTMVSRLEAAQHEVATFDPNHRATGAVRERLAMWEAAGRALVAHPALGIGPDRYRSYVHDRIVAGKSSPAIGSFNQPHNEYLRAAASGGIPGLLVLLLAFALPLRFFLRHARDNTDDVALPAIAGVAIIGLYILCAMTDSVFYRVMSQSFYFFMVTGFAVLIGSRLAARGAHTVAVREARSMPARAFDAHGARRRLG